MNTRTFFDQDGMLHLVDLRLRRAKGIPVITDRWLVFVSYSPAGKKWLDRNLQAVHLDDQVGLRRAMAQTQFDGLAVEVDDDVDLTFLTSTGNLLNDPATGQAQERNEMDALSKTVLNELRDRRTRLLDDADAIGRVLNMYGIDTNGQAAPVAAPAPAGTVILQEAQVPAKPRAKRTQKAPAKPRTAKPKDASSTSGRRPRVSADEMRTKIIDAVGGTLVQTDAEGYSIETLTEGLDVNRPAVVKALDALKEEGLVRETTGKGKGWRFLPTGQAPATPAEAPQTAQEAPAATTEASAPATDVEPPADVLHSPDIDEPDAVNVDGDEEVTTETEATVNFG